MPVAGWSCFAACKGPIAVATTSENLAGSCRIASEADLLRVRQILRECSRQLGLGLVDQTKLITAGSELARNILKYAAGAGGKMHVEVVQGERRPGLRAVFADQGPGISDIELAMKDGYSSSGSMGLGLPGSRRLVDDFHISSAPGGGTTVTIVKWSR
jgi:serine/threonine-protein kinase RsbT